MEFESDSSDVPEWPEELPPPPQRPRNLDQELSKGKVRHQKTLLDAVTSRKSPLYDNCKLLSKEGELMAMISRKRYKWYLKKGLAEALDEYSIRINFDPKGPGGAEYGITEKENICVVCGGTSNLFRTYIVPHSYRSELPTSMSASQSHDVVLQCENCFPLWAKASGKMREKLAKDHNAPVNGVVYDEDTMSTCSKSSALVAAKSAAKALLKVGPSIPAERRAALLERVANYFGYVSVNDVNDSELKELAAIEAFRKTSGGAKDRNLISHERIVVAAFQGHESDLVRLWRQLFLDVCAPRHLPKFWSVDFIKD